MKMKKIYESEENKWRIRKLMNDKKTNEGEENVCRWKTDEDEESLWKWRKLMKDKKTNEG